MAKKRIKEAVAGIVLIIIFAFALSNPKILGFFWQTMNELSYEKDINLTINESANYTLDIESPRIPRLIDFKLTGNLNGTARIYLKSAENLYLVVDVNESFTEECIETCSIDEFNQTSFELIIELNGTLELLKADYAVQNLTWVDDSEPEVEEEVVEEEEEKVDVIVMLEEPKGKKFKISGEKEKEELKKEKIKLAQEEVKKAIDKNKTKINHEYSGVNAMALSVTEEELEKLKKNKNVKKIVKDRPVKASLTESVHLINADDIWVEKVNGINLTGKGITVCVIDTGIDYNHSDLGGPGFPNSKVIGGYNFCADENCSAGNNDPYDNNGHGTHVAGIIAANGSARGVAPEAKIVAVKVLNSDGDGAMSDVAAAIEWCIENQSKYNISVISMSLGDGGQHDDPVNDCSGDVVDIKIDDATAKNILVVAASGNEGKSTGIAYPACAPNATSVGASDDGSGGTTADQKSIFTNTHAILDLMAPGRWITSTVPKGSCEECNPSGYKTLSGTSMATPHAAGAAAIIYQKELLLNNKNATPSVVRELLKTRTDSFVSSWPRIDALQAVEGVLEVNETENSLKKSGRGKVKFGTLTDLTKAPEAFEIGQNYIIMNASKYPEFDKAANLTIYNLDYNHEPLVFKDGAICVNCTNTNYDGENHTFEVTGFSNYSTGANAKLHIFDENDEEGGWLNRTTHEEIIFYANYTNTTSGAAIGAGVCNVTFSDTNGSMGYNSTTGLFEFRRNFTIAGPYEYNVSCNGTDYECLVVSDDIAVLPDCGLPPPGINWTINGSYEVICENEVLYFKNQTLILKDNGKLTLYNTTILLKDSKTNYDILINGSEFNISYSNFSSQTTHLFNILSYKSLRFDNVTVNKTLVYIKSGNSTLKNSKLYNRVYLQGDSNNLLDNNEFFDDVFAEDDSKNKIINNEFNDYIYLIENSVNEINKTLFKNRLYLYHNSINNFTLLQSNVSNIWFLATNPKIYGYVNMPSSVGSFQAGTTVQRFYPVRINYTNGNAAANKYVNITNGTNILWEGHTNAEGMAYPNLTFVSTTYTDTYNISANPTQSIEMLTDTPILFTLPNPPGGGGGTPGGGGDGSDEETTRRIGGAAPWIAPVKENETEENSTEEVEEEIEPVVEKPEEIKPKPKKKLPGWARALIIASLIIKLITFLASLFIIFWFTKTIVADGKTVEKLIKEDKLKRYRKIYVLKDVADRHPKLKNLVAFEPEEKYRERISLIHKTFELPFELCKGIVFAQTHFRWRIKKKIVLTTEEIPDRYRNKFKRVRFRNPIEEKKK